MTLLNQPPVKTSNSILIIGCGNLGSRLLQALGQTSSSGGRSLTVYALEIDANARQTAQERFAATRTEDVSLTFISSVTQAPTEIDLLIIATNSRNRLAALSSALKHAQIRTILLEKVLFVSLEEFDTADALLRESNAKVWVNCSRNVWPGYLDLKAELAKNTVMSSISVRGADWGMASNAIHFLALVEFLSGHKMTKLELDYPSARIRPSKRENYQEMTGTLSGTFADNSTLEIRSYAEGTAPLEILIQSAHKTFEIHEAEQRIIDSELQQSKHFNVLRASDLNATFKDIIDKEQCTLPTYGQSARLHKLLFKAIDPLMADYGGDPLVYPIT